MLRIVIACLIAGVGISAGGWALWRHNSGTRSGGVDAVQWPFDSGELSSLMSRVISEQRERINAIEDTAGRDRASAFLRYYERRRQAAAS